MEDWEEDKGFSSDIKLEVDFDLDSENLKMALATKEEKKEDDGEDATSSVSDAPPVEVKTSKRDRKKRSR